MPATVVSTFGLSLVGSSTSLVLIANRELPDFPELIFLARTLAVVLAYPLVWLQQKSLLSSKAIRLSRNTRIGRIKLLLSDMGKGFDF